MSCVVVAVVWALRAFYRQGESSAVTHGWCLVQRGVRWRSLLPWRRICMLMVDNLCHELLFSHLLMSRRLRSSLVPPGWATTELTHELCRIHRKCTRLCEWNWSFPLNIHSVSRSTPRCNYNSLLQSQLLAAITTLCCAARRCSVDTSVRCLPRTGCSPCRGS